MKHWCAICQGEQLQVAPGFIEDFVKLWGKDTLDKTCPNLSMKSNPNPNPTILDSKPNCSCKLSDLMLSGCKCGEMNFKEITTELKLQEYGFDEFCEDYFEELAVQDQDGLIRLLDSGKLMSWDLTFAAEIGGKLLGSQVVPSLVRLLKNPSASVREGALHGLVTHMTFNLEDLIRSMINDDPSEAVRSVAKQVVEDSFADRQDRQRICDQLTQEAQEMGFYD